MTKVKPMSADASRPRDREGTERALIEAAKQVLAEEGFQSFGVNAIARRAGCDKQLIYRYFGGLKGLADAIGADLAESLAAELTPLSAAAPPKTYAALMERLLLGLLQLLRRNRLIQQINAWETAMPSPLTQRFVEARARRLGAWMQEMRGDLTPPKGVDAPAINAVLIASVQQLVLSASASGAFSGLSLETDEHWRRAESALASLVRAAYRQQANR